MSRVFVPGFGASASLYRLPDEWTVHRPPTFRLAASVEARLGALQRHLDHYDGPITLAGHSMGGALAIAAAGTDLARIERLLLVNPAGLPLTKPFAASLRDFSRQVVDRLYPRGELLAGLRDAVAAPRATYALALAVRALDLRDQLEAVRRKRIPTEVIACIGDTLTPLEHCKQIAKLAGARYRELDLRGGHMWMLAEPAALASVLD
jgi:pimeloyl-ACP methyl ester carboxylesterase